MPETRKAIHEQPKLCGHILNGVKDSSVPLQIAASSIAQAGSGLFVINDVAAGSEIFRSRPLLVVCEGNGLRVCDYCFCDPTATVHPDGRFYTDGEKRVMLSACTGCKNVEYCSKVSKSLRSQCHALDVRLIVFASRNANEKLGDLTTNMSVRL